MRCLWLVCGLALISSASFAGEYDWKVTKSWTPALEDKFSEFVSDVGESGCRSLDSCIKSKTANRMYYSKTPKSKKFPADCADFPYALRMFFAWMEGLPFDYVSSPELANSAKETIKDIRYSKYGNKPNSIRSIVRGEVYNAHKEINRMRNTVSTATYRMHYDYQSDFYPTELNRKHIKPGTIAYDPAGHAAIVYKVEEDGRIKMMDAHPDNSVTRITYDKKFVRSRPAHGAGLRNWRPELDDSETRSLPGFSEVQFNRMGKRKKIPFVINGQKVGYYDYLRTQMAGGNLTYNPVVELKSMIGEICSNIHDRTASVNAAIRNKIHKKRHPEKLPENIYGTHGEWEDFSTPSRDARLKVAFIEMNNEVKRFIKMYKNSDKRISYEPKKSNYSGSCKTNSCYLAGSLLDAYDKMNNSSQCKFVYNNSNGRDVALRFNDISSRLFKLSFDPYHCIELRWGASGDELASCRDNSNKMQWYKEQQNLRNQKDRTYDLPMGYGLGELHKIGVPKAPEANLLNTLYNELD